ncbi:uncharacterized protein LOC144708269 [Wolffia australiana]
MKRQCRLPLKVSTYAEHVLCDVLPMKVGSIILGRPWLYDHEDTLAGRANTCSFTYQGRRVTWHPYVMKPVNKLAATKPVGLMVVRGPLFAGDLGRKGGDTSLCLAVTLDVPADPLVAPRSPEVEALISEFGDIFPDELPGGLPPMRNIQHAIDLVPSASLPNLPHYRMELPKYEELLRQVRELLEKGLIHESLSPCALYAHPKKCSFLTSEVAFLGFIVSAQGVAADPEKFRHCTHYRLPQGGVVRLDTGSKMSFPADKAHDDPSAGTTPSRFWEVEFFSEKLNDAKLRYSTYDKEVYAVIQALRHWRHYLLSSEFVIFSDHEALKYLQSQQKLSDRHARWVEYLKDYTLVIKHKKGKDNVVADALSRRAHVLNVMNVIVLGFETVRDGYDSCLDFSRIIAEVRRAPSQDYRDFVLTDGYQFYKNRLCVPRTSLRDFLTWECHTGGLNGHFGRNKMIAAVEYQFYWPSM